MKNIIFITLLLFSFSGVSQELKVDTKNISVSFVFVNDKTEGTIGDIGATVQLNPSDLAKSVIIGIANVESLSTGNKARDKHLKSKSFFDAENFPTMKFTSTEITVEGESFNAKGTLTIKDVTKEVIFTFKINGNTMVLETTIYSSDFGVSIKGDREKNEVTIKVNVPLS